MPRQPRFYVPGAVLHIVQRGVDRAAIFRNASDRRHYLDCLAFAATKHRAAVHAYVLMSNHVHIVLSPSDECSAPRMMQVIGRRYVARFNFLASRTGTLWEGRYKAAIVDTDAYLFACMRYVELNPVRAGMARHPAEFVWSSHRANIGLTRDALITPHSAFVDLAHDDAARWRAYSGGFTDGMNDELLDSIRDATRHQWALGNAAFRTRVTNLSGRRAERLPRGRPGRANSGVPSLSTPSNRELPDRVAGKGV